jgi:dihydrofolate reductase
MGRLIYTTIASLDGYVEDATGRFDFMAPDEEVFRFINERERSDGTHLLGRRMYETMVYWETLPLDDTVPDFIQDWTRIWRAAEKIVFSRTLASPSSARTRVERNFDPEAIRRLKQATTHDLSVAGADLAGQALRAGLVDELALFAAPVAVGSGKPWLPKDLRLDLELLETRGFAGGTVFLRYRPKPGA